MSRRALLIAVVGAIACAQVACVQGGADEVDAGPSKHDAFDVDQPIDQEPDDGLLDAGGDTIVADDGGTTTDTATTAPDTGTASDSTTIFETEPLDAGCTPVCTVCGGSDSCGGKCTTGSCSGAGEACVSGACVAPTRSHLSPGSYAFGSAWAKGITWTLASEGAADIVYTLDGSTPGPTSAKKPSPVDLFVATSGTVIKWYADNGAKEITTHSFTANIDSAQQSSYGFIVDKVNLASKGPVVVVSPGATISGNALYQAWNGSGCPGCRYQLVYGIGATSAGCLYDYSPGVYPGASGTGTISVTAPSTAGSYNLNVSYTLQLSCADGMATNPLGVRPTATIATIVVK